MSDTTIVKRRTRTWTNEKCGMRDTGVCFSMYVAASNTLAAQFARTARNLEDYRHVLSHMSDTKFKKQLHLSFAIFVLTE